MAVQGPKELAILDRSQASPYHRHLYQSRCPRELGGVKQDGAADRNVRIHDQNRNPKM